MQIEGSHTFQAPRQAVWDALMDPAVLAQALPGGEQIEQTGENEYRAAMNVRIGPVQGKFQGKIELADVTPLESYVMRVNGQGAPGFVTGEGTLALVDQGEQTLLNYAGEVQIGGRIAGVSQRLIDSTAKSLTRQGLESLERQIQQRLQPEPMPAESTMPAESETTRSAAAPAPSTLAVGATVAKDVAQDLAADYIPLEQQEKVFYAALGALGMLLFVILVRLVQK